MTDSNYPEAATTHNSRSLNTLIRAITLSSGRRFSLIFVRCNYTELQEQICQDLHQQCGVEIRELMLSPSTDTLYSAIKTEVGDESLSALIILGLETVTDLDNLLLATNHVRDEFIKEFKFPLVIWVTDEVLKKLVRLAPDLYNWGAPPISFFLTPEALIEFLNRGVEAVFAENQVAIPELELALKYLQGRGEELAADLTAGLEFVWGREDYIQDNLDDAIVHYQQCLSLWQSPPEDHPERKGIVWIHLGFCYRRQAELNRAEKRRYWQEARDYFQQGLGVFKAAQRPDLVARFIGELGEVLRQLEAWDELQELAEKGLRLHQIYVDERQQARDYGFLAEVALARGNWQEAKRLANQALQCRDAPWRVSTNVPAQEHSLYLFLLAKAQQGLNQIQSAIETLERVRVETHPQANPQVYSDSLKELQRLYFNQQDYLKAFAIKQEQGLVESQLGLRAFIGASRLQPLPGEFQDKVALEITASGRGRDVERLISRIARDDCKLTVIHGQSGVGKSSIVNGGLVPALRQKMVKALDVLPIPLRVYTNWVEELGRLLAEGLETRAVETATTQTKPAFAGSELTDSDLVRAGELRLSSREFHSPEQGAILAELRQNEQRHRLVVLIFDQFEEFFFVCQDTAARKPFFEFLSDCLNLPDVKVILSLREDYLHYLLECERLARIDVINNDILNKSNRYELGDFAPEDAQAIIEQLTARSQFHLESELVEQLVQDLAGDTGKVRPIELQIVGAQLQAEGITTLAEYRQRGTKDELVQRYVEAVIKDCGQENQRVGELVLYLLTDEKNTRPLKTRSDLISELRALPLDWVMDSQQLELVLKIFVDSGLVVLLPEKPEDRYQLVHDYLVAFIRQQEGFGIVAELKAERERRRRSEAQLKVVKQRKQQVEQELTVAQAELERVNQEARETIQRANQQLKEAEERLADARKKQQEAQAELAEAQAGTRLERAGVAAIKQFEYQQIEALLSAMKAGQDLKKWVQDGRPLEKYPATSPLLALQKILDKIWERNQLQHPSGVLAIAFSPDGKQILTGSSDYTARLWDNQGNLIQK
ncbi:nSTAND1 domain-containing NTPase, partial [Coleofasciculus sp.]|uniref:nSTAND1 domain-containing NTPase n=1 Tax=Coleofasciculus sp. TaxID=3100458 RepID=UPI0039F98BB7